MPIKLPKGFQRRKSSGPALEEITNPPEPSFRVFERPHNASKSFDGGHVLGKSIIAVEERPVASQKLGLKEANEPLFPVSRADLVKRNSTWTDNSISTKAPYSSAASSARLSSSSTIPSSTDTRSDVSAASGNPKPFHDIPVPPNQAPRPPFSFRSSTRTFSFGNRTGGSSSMLSQPPLPAVPRAAPISDSSRDRAFSSSTASTATPPKLLDADLSFGSNDADEFSNMFDNIGERDSTIMSSRQDLPSNAFPSSPAATMGRPDHLRPQRFATPSPINVDRSEIVESSPYSHTSQNSQDGLIRSPSPDIGERSLPPLPREAISASQERPNVASAADRGNQELARRSDAQYPSSLPQQSPKGIARLPSDFMRKRRQSYQQARRLERNGSGALKTDSTLSKTASRTSDSDSIQKSKTASRASDSDSIQKYKTASRTSDSDSIQKSEAASPPPSPTLTAGALLAAEWEQKEQARPVVQKPASKNKVMTPAQFERYRQQQEMEHKKAEVYKDNQSDGDSDSDNYEDDDEAERDRRATAQRRKQEAQLAVYRQTMMKVTGEQRPQSRTDSIERLSSRIPSSGSLDLTKSISNLALDPKASVANGKSSGEEDEDEDVPLGILAAHGFPNKNRPPTRLTNQSSNPNLRAVSGVGSVAAEPKPGPKGGLPPFARHLPQDPYYGASLVNPSNRESFAMGGGSSVHGGQVPGTPPGLHPAGLVGVIAGEERARAMRRGSPNPSGGYEMPPGMIRSQTMGNFPMGSAPGMVPGMVPGMALPLTPADQAQIQMSQQMTQMMQMQMQWMQQMSQMVQQGQGQTMQPPPNVMQQPGALPGSPGLLAPPAQIARPLSMPMPEMGSPRLGQRTMSSLSPGMAPWNRPLSFASSSMQVSAPGAGPAYTPSIAPSERSNVGLASRYRPVSIAPADGIRPAAKRSSTFTSGTVRPVWTNGATGRRSPGALSTIRSIGGQSSTGKSNAKEAPDDEDDDQGWAEMKKKRDKKKSTWKMKRAQTQGAGLEDFYNI